MWSRKELKMRGKAAMKSNWGACIVVALLMGLISGSGGGSTASSGTEVAMNNIMDPSLIRIVVIAAFILVIIGSLFTIFVANVLKVGGYKFFTINQAGMQPGIGMILDGFKSGKYTNIVYVMFMKDLFITLWTLLLIVPGIIKSYEYFMVPYILAENPGMDRKAALSISKQMMDGEKWDTFILQLSFIGWYLVSLFTLGILAVAYVNPYVEATKAELYAYCKQKGFQQGFIKS